MKKLFLGATVLGILLLAACKNEQKETTDVNDMATDGEAMHHEINTDSVVHVINGLREGLEMKASGMDKVKYLPIPFVKKLSRNGPNLIST
ncbi:MAG: hypothetical protein R2773_06330 [Flavobacteriaceae bacterium]